MMGNSICHVEFVSANMDETQAFYEQVFGWNTKPMGDEYCSWHSGGEGEIGGGFTFCKEEEAKKPATTVYIHVEDIEATLAKIESQGGKTEYPKTQISEEHGFFAIFTDPHGNRIGLWSKT
jgi:predicted enzyme related to lactoylglutathione lyase